MRKILILITSFAMILSISLTTINASSNDYIYSNDPFEVKNGIAKKKMDNYLKKKTFDKNDKKIFDFNEYGLETSSGFDELKKVADGENDLEFLYSYHSENVNDIIAYDKTDSAYMLIEEDLVNNTAMMMVNNETYTFNVNDNNISLTTKNG